MKASINTKAKSPYSSSCLTSSLGFVASFFHRYTIALCCVVVLQLISACSTTNIALQETRKTYLKAEATTEIARAAPAYLNRALEALQIAEQLHFDGRDDTIVNHYTYLANRHLEIAKQVAKKEFSEQQIALANKNRQQVLYNIRVAEANQARSQLNAVSRQLKDLNGRQTDRGIVFTMSDIVFDHNAAKLHRGSLQNIRRLAYYLKQNPENKVLVEGFTDSIGSASYNQKLSDRRANAVRRALIEFGVEANRVNAFGYGELHPVSTNSTAIGQQRNRRVEIVISRGNEDIPLRTATR